MSKRKNLDGWSRNVVPPSPIEGGDILKKLNKRGKAREPKKDSTFVSEQREVLGENRNKR